MENEHSTSDPTPHWQELRDNKPKAHDFLEALAEAVYELGEDSVPFSSLNRPSIDVPELEGLVERKTMDGDKGGEQVAFADEHVRQDYVVRHGASLLQEPWTEGDKVFAGAFGRIARQITLIDGHRPETRATLLRIIAKGREANVLVMVREFAERGISEKDEERTQSKFWALYGPFCDALPHLDVRAEDIMQNASPIIEASAGDQMGGRLYSAVRKMAQQSEDRALALYEASVSRPELAVISLATDALVGLSEFDFTGAHKRALRLTEKDQSVLRRVGMAALGQMTYNEEHSIELQKTWERLEALRENPNEETDYALVRSYGDLLSGIEQLSGEEAAEILNPNDIGGAFIEMAGRTDTKARHAAVQVLFLKAEKYTNTDWYREGLLKVADTPSGHRGTIRKIDSCANRYIQGESTSLERAIEFVRAFAQKRPDGGEVHELLGMTLRSLQENFFEELQAELTRWLSTPEPNLHRAAADLYQSHDGTGSRGSERRFRLSKNVLDQVSEQQVVWIVFRTCGYIAGGGERLASLVLSALQRDSASDELVRLIGDMISEYVLYNYPEGGREYLQRVLEEDEVPEVERSTAHEAMERSERYYRQLRELPPLKEFAPPSSRIYQLRRIQQQHQSEMMEEARNQSVFMNLVSLLPLKYGNAFFSEQEPGGFTEPSELGRFSHSVELPREAHIDPVGLAYKRGKWRQVGLET